MMKRYIKPNTEIHEIEMAQMIALSMNKSSEPKDYSESLSKKFEVTIESPDLWDTEVGEEEEE